MSVEVYGGEGIIVYGGEGIKPLLKIFTIFMKIFNVYVGYGCMCIYIYIGPYTVRHTSSTFLYVNGF